MQTENVWESAGNYYTKIPTLICNYINKKGIGVANNVIPKTEYRWIDTDYTVHPSRNHPPIPPVHGSHDAVSWILAHNRKYSIGRVVDIERKTADNGIHTLKTIVRFEDPKLAKQAYQEGLVPLYNSSSIYEIARDNETGLTTDYVPIDNCAVDTPAGELELFKTGDFCEGGTECIHDLKQSAINGECGYCKLGALKSFQFHYPIELVHDSHNSLPLQQSSSMSMSEQVTDTSRPPAANQQEPVIETTKEARNKQNKSKAHTTKSTNVQKLGKEINDSGWVSSNEDREESEEESEKENEEEQQEEGKSEAKLDYKKLYEEEKLKNESTDKTVQELVAESRVAKLTTKFASLPIEIWEGDEKARAKDVEFFNSIHGQKVDDKLMNKLIEKYISKIPIEAIQLASKRLGLKQSGWSPLDEIVTHNFVARTKSQEGETQLSEGDVVLGALED